MCTGAATADSCQEHRQVVHGLAGGGEEAESSREAQGDHDSEEAGHGETHPRAAEAAVSECSDASLKAGCRPAGCRHGGVGSIRRLGC